MVTMVGYGWLMLVHEPPTKSMVFDGLCPQWSWRLEEPAQRRGDFTRHVGQNIYVCKWLVIPYDLDRFSGYNSSNPAITTDVLVLSCDFLGKPWQLHPYTNLPASLAVKARTTRHNEGARDSSPKRQPGSSDVQCHSSWDAIGSWLPSTPGQDACWHPPHRHVPPRYHWFRGQRPQAMGKADAAWCSGDPVGNPTETWFVLTKKKLISAS